MKSKFIIIVSTTCCKNNSNSNISTALIFFLSLFTCIMHINCRYLFLRPLSETNVSLKRFSLSYKARPQNGNPLFWGFFTGNWFQSILFNVLLMKRHIASVILNIFYIILFYDFLIMLHLAGWIVGSFVKWGNKKGYHSLSMFGNLALWYIRSCPDHDF